MEPFTEDEQRVLSRFFTNVDLPVFALVNLPEVVKGALFARYSRTHKSLRRLFLDEFVTDPDAGIETIASVIDEPPVKHKRAEQLYNRVFDQYGDDSVAQLGGAHLACEQASNVLTKILEWGRLAAYLEQSTRYIAYDQRLGGRYRFFVPPEVEQSGFHRGYVSRMNTLFGTYQKLKTVMVDYFARRYPRRPGDPQWVHRAAVRAKAFDSIRGLLPASTLSNVGMYATGQSYEHALMRMRAHPLAEARDYADMMLAELRKVIPSFLTRVDRPDRGVAWSSYLSTTRQRLQELADRFDSPAEATAEVTLVDWDPHAEAKLAAAALYPMVGMPETQTRRLVDGLDPGHVAELVACLGGERTNRRHKPGRALERIHYRFDIACDYAAFRDLQRHRMLTIEWQPLSTRLGFDTPEVLTDAGAGKHWEQTVRRTGEFYETLREGLGRDVAQYAVPFAYKIRFVMEMNAREALHMIELRTQPSGHPSYRKVCAEMHRQIVETAGHENIGKLFGFLNTQGVDQEPVNQKAAMHADNGEGLG